MTDRDRMLDAMTREFYNRDGSAVPPRQLARRAFDAPGGPGERIKELEAQRDKLAAALEVIAKGNPANAVVSLARDTLASIEEADDE